MYMFIYETQVSILKKSQSPAYHRKVYPGSGHGGDRTASSEHPVSHP